MRLGVTAKYNTIYTYISNQQCPLHNTGYHSTLLLKKTGYE